MLLRQAPPAREFLVVEDRAGHQGRPRRRVRRGTEFEVDTDRRLRRQGEQAAVVRVGDVEVTASREPAAERRFAVWADDQFDRVGPLPEQRSQEPPQPSPPHDEPPSHLGQAPRRAGPFGG